MHEVQRKIYVPVERGARICESVNFAGGCFSHFDNCLVSTYYRANSKQNLAP